MVTRTKRLRQGAMALMAAAGLVAGGMQLSAASAHPRATHQSGRAARTRTPIKHLVVLFDENVSYDHYFGTYPKAANTDGTTFHAASHTPKNKNLVTSGALTNNPNAYAPTRLTHAQNATCSQNHNYTPEQKAVNGGAMDKFVESTSVDTCTGLYGSPGLAMDYFDGNTVTGLWNYAQNYAMSDNMWDSTFGPSTPGALNLVSGQTHGGTAYDPKTGAPLTGSTAVAGANASGVGTVIADPDPAYDDCSNNDHTSTSAVVGMSGKNVGDRLNEKNISWGWFQGGFTPSTAWDGVKGDYAKCESTTTNTIGQNVRDYSPHHSPFEYYKSTSNPHHLAPKSLAEVGHDGRANHNYDLSYFEKAVKANSLPAVSFVKAPQAHDGHAVLLEPARRAEVPDARDQRDRVVEVVVEHRDRRDVRRLGRLVRPRRAEDPQRIGRPRDGPGGVHHRCGQAGERAGRRLRGPVWTEPAAAVPRDLALRKAQRGLAHAARAAIGAEVHRAELGGQGHRRPLVRRPGQQLHLHVRLPAPSAAHRVAAV